MSEEKAKPKRSITSQLLRGLGFCLVLIVVLFLVADFTMMKRWQDRHVDRASRYMRSIGYTLFNFENDFGCYPNDETAKELVAGDDDVILSSSGGSNFYFSQLVAGGYLPSESMFFLETGFTIHADNLMSTPDEMLAPGEVGYSYVVWESSRDLPGEAPLMFAYLGQDLKSAEPWSRPYWMRKRVVVLRRDMSVEIMLADRDGAVRLDGKDYFDWSQPHWGGQKPRIEWPAYE